jgi:NADH:ubiquinone oxidoreductase subunit D
MIFEAMGKSFTLKYDFNSMCEIEERAGKGFDQLLEQKTGIYLSTRYLLWGGLLKNHRNITLEQVGAIIEDMQQNGKKLVDIVEMIFRELVDSGFINKSKEQGDNEPMGEQKPERDSM